MRLFCVFLLTAAGLAGCVTNEPCYGLKVGQRLKVELIETYDENSSFEFEWGNFLTPKCPAKLDLTAPSELTVRVVAQPKGNFCLENVIELESSVPRELGEPVGATQPFGADVISGAFRTTIEGCNGLWEVGVLHRGEPGGAEGDPFLPPPAEKGVPPMIFVRQFSANPPISPECEAFLGGQGYYCYDFFVTQLSPL